MGKNRFKKREKTSLEDRRKNIKETRNKENVAVKKTSSTYSVDQLLDKAEEFLDNFDYDLAQKFCQRALEVDRENIRALELTGSVLLELGDQESAEQCFLRSVEISPEEGHAKYMYLGQLNKGADAIKYFSKGIELMIQAQQKEAEIVGASNISEDKPVAPIDISNAYCSIAEIYMTDCCFDDSAESKCKENIESAISSDPNNAEAYQLKASYLLSLDQKQEGKEMINKSLSLWLPKAKCKEEELPDTEFDPVQIVPLSFESRINTCRILIEVEEYQSAVDVAEGLLDENDEDPQVWYLIGWANYLQGEDYKNNARFYLNKAHKVYKKNNYDDPDLYKHIEELLQELPPGYDDDDDDDGGLLHEQDLDAIHSSDEEDMEH
ncbi:hypothetical protein LOTGIDRAFT_237436 [Lottia gigantea]|uniref:Uncharacterized protein n=1 Tax=Lottia gigantea TaxID=225164 RepID=V4AJ89_LOTGI|nr:hypothetical protein LOTGIDRAFT_237436 [Lottia gigantea]ESP04239.1 hypothetical protein LOTGIDRAFT_237436 [Lottia gigantea]